MTRLNWIDAQREIHTECGIFKLEPRRDSGETPGILFDGKPDEGRELAVK